MYDDVLLPVDENATSSAVLRHASELAHWADATVTLLYVADTARDSVTVVEASVVDALEQQGRDVVDEAAETLANLGADYETDIVQGDPATTIVDYAERYDYDLIVMPTQGREGVSRYLLGSVSEKVVRLSSVPVLTSRMREDEKLVFPYERVLVPTDGSDAAAAAADHGLGLAASLEAAVHVLSVVDDGPDLRSSTIEEASTEAARAAVESVAADARDRGIDDVRTHVEDGAPDEVILDAVETHDLHAVVMGTTGRRGVDRILLGSVAEKTVRSAPVPVVTVAGDR